MKTGANGIALIKFYEGLKLTPYLCSGDVVTIGYGSTLKDKAGKMLKGQKALEEAIKTTTKITKEQAEELLKKDLVRYESIVNNKVKVKLNQNQFDALVSHTFNTGGSSTLFDLINTRELTSNAIEVWWTTRYIMAGGKPLNGLVARRRKEYELFSTNKLVL